MKSRILLWPATALLAGAVVFPAAAQRPGAPDSQTIVDRSRALHVLEQEASRQPHNKEDAAVQWRQHELTGRLAAFAESWNKLIKGAENGVWNAKQAKKTRQAFERLVKAQGWIEDGK